MLSLTGMRAATATYFTKVAFAPKAPSLSKVGIVVAVATIALTAATILYSKYIGFNFNHHYRMCLSHVVSYLNCLSINPKFMISRFRKFDFKPIQRPNRGGHSHEQSANTRSFVNKAIESFIVSIGYKPYNHQMSNYDQKRGIDGSRSYYWPKDLQMKPRNDDLKDYHIRVLTDVDYYEDMKKLLLDAVPTILYTINPDEAAKCEEEYSYNFDKDNNFNYIVAGSGHYKHPLWDWNHDHTSVTHTFLGFPVRTVVYQIDRRTVCPDRDIVFLTPMFELGFIGSIISRWLMNYQEIDRLRVNQGAFNRLEIKTQSDHYISTAICEPTQYTSATVKICQDNYFANLSKTMSTPIAPYHVTSHLKYPADMTQHANEVATIMTAYHNSRLAMPATLVLLGAILPKFVCHTLFPRWFEKNQIIYPVTYSSNTYSFSTAINPGPPIVKPFMAPFLPDSYIPTRDLSTEERAINGRVKEIAVPEMDIGSFLRQVMCEFADHLVPVPHTLHPVDVDRVFEQQPRPGQRKILSDAIFLPLKHFKQTVMEFFIKSESYAKPADPRVISTINGTTKIDASKFMYALADHLHPAPWYAFGKTPEEISRHVSNICQSAQTHVSLSDLSRMDGHVSNVLRELDSMVLLRYFSSEHHQDINNMLSNLTHLNGVGKFNTKFETLFAQCSGDPWTAILNSIRNLFLHFLAFRCTKLGKDAFIDADTAWHNCYNCVMVGGDDGIAADISQEPFDKACKLVGQVLEYDSVSVGGFGVNFLARYYTREVWKGDLNSCCDIKRQLLKFHLSSNLPPDVTPSQKLVEKCRSFNLSDHNTPIIGKFSSKVVEIAEKTNYTRPSDEAVRKLATWITYSSPQSAIPNAPSHDYMELLQTQLPSIETLVGDIYDWIDKATTIEELLLVPTLKLRDAPLPHPTVPVVINGVEVPAANSHPQPSTNTSSGYTKTPPRATTATNRPKPTIHLVPKPKPSDQTSVEKRKEDKPAPTKPNDNNTSKSNVATPRNNSRRLRAKLAGASRVANNGAQ